MSTSSTEMHETRLHLLQAAESFCHAFASKRPPEEIFAHFSELDDVRAFEHGLPDLAPFLGREFTGQGGIKKYFDSISSLLEYDDMSFSNFVVDPVSRQVSCRGHARFTWLETKQGWNETFAYMLGFDNHYKVKSYEIWADTGAAYLASKGQLKT